MKPIKPIFTIVTVTYNCEDLIKNTLESIINQDFDDYEYIIIDGNSTDNTLNIIKSYKYKFDDKITIISENDNGIYDAMNKGMKLAKGELICFMNSGDTFFSGALKYIKKFYIENPEYDIYYGDTNNVKIIDENTFNKVNYAEKDNKDVIKKKMLFCHQSSFIKRILINDIGIFNTEYRIAADWDFFVRCYKNNKKFKYIGTVVSNFLMGGTSNSNYSKEKHQIRKDNNLVGLIDKYYIAESIFFLKYFVLKKLIPVEFYNRIRIRYFQRKMKR